MKSPYVGDLVPNETVTAQFLVLSKEIRQKKTGEPYLTLHLADRTGEIEAKMWDNVVEVMHTFERDDFVKVKGIAQLYQNRSQFTIHRLRRLEEHEVDFADFFPCSERDPDEMWTELQSHIASLRNVHLRSLLEAVFSDERLTAMYRMAPAAKNIHHACRGGLLEHVLSLCALSRLTASHYKDIDVELLIAAAILHDIGKIEELSYSRSFGYSSDGQLLGHIVLGVRLLSDAFSKVPDFPPRLRTLLEHMIISHHGELEFGSPKVPSFPEALLFHHLDNLDSKMDAVRNAFKRDSHLDGEFTGWVASLERILLRKDRYLQQASQAANTKPAAPPEPKPVAVAARETPSQSTKPPGNATPQNVPATKPEPTTFFGEKLRAVLRVSE
ncbi:MAG TPA: HD domain-containing protein [Bryobacteraceae bacterium]|jgi:3'-5' exoribonuclease